MPRRKVEKRLDAQDDRKRVVIYLRVSTKMQLDGYGLDAQLDNCMKFARENNYEVFDIKSDKAISGKKGLDVREGLDEAIKLCLNGDCDIFLCSAIDRQSRDFALFRDVRDKLAEKHIPFMTAKEGENFAMKSKRFMGNIYAVVAEEEAVKIAGRLLDGRIQKSKINGRGSSYPTYGYKSTLIDEKNKKVIIDEKEAEVVRIILTMRDQGQNYSAIARYLNDQNIPSPGGVKWLYTSVRHIEQHRELYTTGKRSWAYTKEVEDGNQEYLDLFTIESAKDWPIIYTPVLENREA